MNVAYDQQSNVTLYGTVSDGTNNIANATVNISGKVTGTATTNSSGYFSFTASATGLGMVYAAASDSAGDSSDTSVVTLSVPAPVVTSFAAAEGITHSFTFSGSVAARSVAGLTVTFAGLPSLQGHTTTVQADGSYSFTTQLQTNGSDNGTAMVAVLSDWWGQCSNVMTTYITVT